MRMNVKRILTGWTRKLAVAVSLMCCVARGDGVFMYEVTPDFWETNLVATVAGYSRVGSGLFLGVRVPAIHSNSYDDNEDDWLYKEEVWLYSIAPTNYAGMLFRFHDCDPGSSLRTIFPTNQLFVFPVSITPRKDTDKIPENSPIIFSPRAASHSHCPCRTFEKWFPTDDSAFQSWTAFLNERIESNQKQITELREKLLVTDDGKKRSSISLSLKECEDAIAARRNQIDELSKQPRYFQDRIKWLESQNVPPPPPEW